MKQKIIYSLVTLLLLAGTGVNTFYLQASYKKYQNLARTKPIAGLKSITQVTSGKLKTVDSTKQGQQVSEGAYKYEELDHSKIATNYGGTAQLTVASDESQAINYVLALPSDSGLVSSKIKSDWTLQTVSTDPIWAPGACSSKPTYFLQGHYIFIDDGKTLPTDKYDSYIVFDMLTQKFRYFGGSNFTDQQGQKENILSAIDENDQIVFYIDPADSEGPLASSTSFKHARGHAPGYIIRRVVDPGTLHYTDYKLSFTEPTAAAFAYYYVSIGSQKDSLIGITSDSSNTAYSGKVANNNITLAAYSITTSLPDTAEATPDPLAVQLDKPLADLLPSFSSGTDTSATSSAVRFGATVLGQHDNIKYLVVNNSQTGYSTPVIFDENSNNLTPLTTEAILDWTNYVALGVF